MGTPGITEGFIEQGEYRPENLIAGEFFRVARIVTITGGVALSQGAVLGKITANNLYQLSDAGASDGSENADVILAEDIDATSGDVQGTVYLSGEFNSLALQLGAGHTLETITPVLRLKSIFLRANQT